MKLYDDNNNRNREREIKCSSLVFTFDNVLVDTTSGAEDNARAVCPMFQSCPRPDTDISSRWFYDFEPFDRAPFLIARGPIVTAGNPSG